MQARCVVGTMRDHVAGKGNDEPSDLERRLLSLGLEAVAELAGALKRSDNYLKIRIATVRLTAYKAAAAREKLTFSEWVVRHLDRATSATGANGKKP